MSVGSSIVYTNTQDLSTGALSMRTSVENLHRRGGPAVVPALAPGRRLMAAILHSSIPIGQTVRVWYRSRMGSNYDAILSAATLSLVSNFVYIPDDKFVIGVGDDIEITCTNNATPSAIVYASILMQEP